VKATHGRDGERTPARSARSACVWRLLALLKLLRRKAEKKRRADRLSRAHKKYLLGQRAAAHKTGGKPCSTNRGQDRKRAQSRASNKPMLRLIQTVFSNPDIAAIRLLQLSRPRFFSLTRAKPASLIEHQAVCDQERLGCVRLSLIQPRCLTSSSHMAACGHPQRIHASERCHVEEYMPPENAKANGQDGSLNAEDGSTI